jgi:hypothetical protein
MDNRHLSKSPLNNPSGSAPQPALSRAIQERLGRELRDMYAEIQRDPVTGRLADLLSQLERPCEGMGLMVPWDRSTGPGDGESRTPRLPPAARASPLRR